MAKKTQFDDPLEDIDPIMGGAYSITEEESSLDDSISSALDDFNVESKQKPHVASPTVSTIQFPDLKEESSGKKLETDIFANIPVTVSVELGRSQITLKEVFELEEGAIIELDRLVGEPLDLVVNGQIVAQGEVVAIDNNYGLRVTTVLSTPQN